ncbi:MobF family relaxase [Streptomyces sp. NPDC005786]|uniref:MobF family relaxase n=1 Tax=Streptomyces sp. NPDC005786 TaxID=3154891 RepID=UPI0033F0125F
MGRLRRAQELAAQLLYACQGRGSSAHAWSWARGRPAVGDGPAGDRAGQAHRAQPLAEDRQGQGAEALAGHGPHVPAPPTAHIAFALMDDKTRMLLELCHDASMGKTLAWVGESVAQIRWGSGGKHRRPIRDGGLIVAVFRHYESTAGESRQLIHDHAVVSIRARRSDEAGTWGNLSADSLLSHIVAADTLYLLFLVEEASARLGWAWEPREVTTGHRPVMDIAGIDQRLIGWQLTRRQQIEDALSVLVADHEEDHGHVPGERAGYALACQAADRTRPPKRKELRSLSELREGGGSRQFEGSAPTSSIGSGSGSGRGRQPQRCGRGCGRWSTSSWLPSTPSPWRT